jgi:hypothetical protein
MAPHNRNPATRDAGRAGNRFNCLAALNGSQVAQALPSYQATFVARRLRLSLPLARIVAELAFPGGRP